MQTGREKGFFVTYNHPAWSREGYNDYINYHGMHAIEMFNGLCIRTSFDDYNPRVYEDLLNAGRKIYCIGGDDNHNCHDDNSRYNESGWAFTVFKADKLDYPTIAKALKNGDFYASEGPEIYDLYIEDDKIYVKCSEVDKIAINYQKRKAWQDMNEDYSPMTEGVFDYTPDCGFFRLTLTDKNGKKACTNAYFPEDL